MLGSLTERSVDDPGWPPGGSGAAPLGPRDGGGHDAAPPGARPGCYRRAPLGTGRVRAGAAPEGVIGVACHRVLLRFGDGTLTDPGGA
jgi:hypothetical protein